MSQTPAPDEAQTHPRTTAALLDRIEEAWSELDQTLGALSEAQLTTISDAQGWTAKDHLVHITTWEQSLLALLQGRDRWQATGLEGGEHGEIDDVNAEIYRRNRHRTLQDVMVTFRGFHQEVVAAITALSDADLFKPYSHYQPQDPPFEAAPVIGWIVGNTYEHYLEHASWIRGLSASR